MSNANRHDFDELPVVLLHGTSGRSEGWSQVVEQLASHRSVIRPNYGEPVAGAVNVPGVSDFAIELWQLRGPVAGIVLTLSVIPLERQLPHS